MGVNGNKQMNRRGFCVNSEKFTFTHPFLPPLLPLLFLLFLLLLLLLLLRLLLLPVLLVICCCLLLVSDVFPARFFFMELVGFFPRVVS